jgi:hypothetical protein
VKAWFSGERRCCRRLALCVLMRCKVASASDWRRVRNGAGGPQTARTKLPRRTLFAMALVVSVQPAAPGKTTESL